LRIDPARRRLVATLAFSTTGAVYFGWVPFTRYDQNTSSSAAADGGDFAQHVSTGFQRLPLDQHKMLWVKPVETPFIPLSTTKSNQH